MHFLLIWVKWQNAVILHWEYTPKLTAVCKRALSLGEMVICLKALSLNWLLFLCLNLSSKRPGGHNWCKSLICRFMFCGINQNSSLNFMKGYWFLHWMRIWFLLNFSICNDKCVGEVTHENYLAGIKLVTASLKQKWWWHMLQLPWCRKASRGDSNETANHLHPKLGIEWEVPVVKGELCVSVLCSVL